MTTPKPCESGACIHVHEEGGTVHIRSTETGDSMTATPAEWSDYLAKVRRDELNVSIQAAERVAGLEREAREANGYAHRMDARHTEHLAKIARLEARLAEEHAARTRGYADLYDENTTLLNRISELELANKTLETALKHSADLNETLQAQRELVLNALDITEERSIPAECWQIGKEIKAIYAGKEQS